MHASTCNLSASWTVSTHQNAESCDPPVAPDAMELKGASKYGCFIRSMQNLCDERLEVNSLQYGHWRWVSSNENIRSLTHAVSPVVPS